MQTGTLRVLWGIGIVLLLSGVLLGLGTGNSGYGILALNGGLLSIWWVALRAFALRTQIFVRARAKILLSLAVITVGSIVLSIGIATSVLVTGGSSDLTLRLTGAFVFLLGITMYILSLASVKRGAEFIA